jgi:ribonuclease Z
VEDFVMAKKPPKSYGYCSDTSYFEPLISSIQGVNLLYHEATFVEKLADRAKATFHSTAKDAATIAHKANVGKLLLGHLSARYDSGDDHLKEAQTIFENTVIVEDGMVFQV